MLGGLPSNVPLPGELFAEKYRIERVLGRGGMGVVFSATHVILQQKLALKMLLPAAAADPETVERFLREGRAAVKIRNEHVARVIDVGELPDRTPYIVMEYLEGQDFGELLDGESQLPFADAIDYVLQACEAVAEAHSLKIVHRDLKPSNLFLAKQPNGKAIVKVLDFGISKSLEPDLAMTRTAAMIGSPLYMSPEQLKSAKDVDARADIWSIGVILYQLIAGNPPFVADSLPELCALVLSSPQRWLHREVPDVPHELSRIVATCLRTNIAERYVNLADFADAVAKFGTPAARSSADAIIKLVGLPESRTALVPMPRVDPALAETRDERAPAALQSTRANWTASSPAPTPTRSRWLMVGGLGAIAIAVAVVGTRPRADGPSTPVTNAESRVATVTAEPTGSGISEAPNARAEVPSASASAAAPIVNEATAPLTSGKPASVRPSAAPVAKAATSIAKPVVAKTVEPVASAPPAAASKVPAGVATSAKD